MVDISMINCMEPSNSSKVTFPLKLIFLTSWKQKKKAFVTWQKNP